MLQQNCIIFFPTDDEEKAARVSQMIEEATIRILHEQFPDGEPQAFATQEIEPAEEEFVGLYRRVKRDWEREQAMSVVGSTALVS